MERGPRRELIANWDAKNEFALAGRTTLTITIKITMSGASFGMSARVIYKSDIGRSGSGDERLT
jgi:hypothetical protein